MTTWRLFAIEARHTVSLLLVPVILFAAWYLLRAQLWEPYLWSSTNELLRKSVVPLAGPAVAGAAAWMAGRDRRRGITDLIATAPRPAMPRHLGIWSATAVWVVLAYLVVLGYMFAQTAPHATWGGPEFWSVAIALAALLAHAAWGHLAGHLVASRFTAPIVAIVAFGVQMYFAGSMTTHSDGTQSSTWLQRLAASDVTERGAPWQALFYSSLCLVGLAVLWLAQRRDVLRGLLVTGAVALSAAAVVMIWAATPRWDFASNRLVNGWGNTIAVEEYTAPEPVCRGDDFVVCAHPQYQPWLDEAVVQAEALAAPLRGLAAFPSTMECRNTGFRTSRDPGSSIDVSNCADSLVADPGTLSRDGVAQNDAQLAIRGWLLKRMGLWSMCDVPDYARHGATVAGACDAADRFAALPEPEQRAWLDAHYADLRSGNLTLADLP